MKPFVIAHAVLLSATGGGPNAMVMLAEKLSARGYAFRFLTRPPFDPQHPYARALTRLGISVRVLPRLPALSAVEFARRLCVAVLWLPYALFRRVSLKAANEAASSIFLSWVARWEARRVRSELERGLAEAKRQGRAPLLQVWGPAALTPTLLKWAKMNDVPALYHEMGEADDAYVRTWNLGETIDSLYLADMVVCASPSVEAGIRAVYGYTGPVRTIPFMVADPGPVEVGDPTKRGLILGSIGRLVPHKRHEDLLRAVRILRDEGHNVSLLIAGAGPERARLDELTALLELDDHVAFTGHFDSLSDVMSRFDVFALVSSSESQCMPVTESMAYGKAVISSRFGGIPDFVEDGVTGFLVPVGDVAAVASAVRRLLLEPGLKRQMGEEGRRRFLERWTPEHVARDMDDAFTSLVSRGALSSEWSAPVGRANKGMTP